MLLGVMVTGAVLQVFTIIHRNMMAQQGIARIAENVRAFETILGKGIHTSGNLGCSRLSEDFPLRVHAGVDKHFNLQSKQGVIITTWGKLNNNSLLSYKSRARMRVDSDVLWINSITNQSNLLQATYGEAGYLLVKNHEYFKKNKVAVLSDCAQADVFKIFFHENFTEKAIQNKLYFSPSRNVVYLSKYYRENAQVGILRSALYYVGKTNRLNATKQPVYALYRTDLNGTTTELVEGVEQIKVTPVYSNDALVRIKMKVLFNSIEDGYAILNQSPDRIIRKWIEFEWDLKTGE